MSEIMLVVGEKINTSLKEVEEAVEKKDVIFLQDLARRQVKGEADILDVNVGTRLDKEVQDMRWIVEVIKEVTDVPLCLDSPHPRVIEVGLEEHGEGAMINSITAEEERMEGILPLVQKFPCKVIALTMDGKGIPKEVEGRLDIAERLVRALTRVGISLNDIYIDPLVFPIGTDPKSGQIALESIRRISSSFKGIHTICGLSNISFGLPKRALLNQSFLLMAMAMGLDSVILDPLEKGMMGALRVGEALLGRDEYCTQYLASFRAGELDP